MATSVFSGASAVPARWATSCGKVAGARGAGLSAPVVAIVLPDGGGNTTVGEHDAAIVTLVENNSNSLTCLRDIFHSCQKDVAQSPSAQASARFRFSASHLLDRHQPRSP